MTHTKNGLTYAQLLKQRDGLLAALQALMQEAGIDENDLASLAAPEAFKMGWDAINAARGQS